MSGANAGSPNASGSLRPKYRVASSGTNTKTIPATPLLPFMAGLSLPDFSKLINDPIHHDPCWSIMKNKLHYDIPKF